MQEQLIKSRQPSPQISRHCRSGQHDYDTVKSIPKRVSLSVFPVRKWCIVGSMTIEAAVLLPLLMFFFLNLCGAIEILRLHGNLTMALRDSGNQISVYGYAYDQLRKGENAEEGTNSALLDTLAGISFSNLYVRQELIGYLGSEYLEVSPLTHGSKGLYFIQSDFMQEQDHIELVMAYQVSPLFGIPGFSSFQMTNRYYGRAWTGYDVTITENTETEDQVPLVYVTANGRVWHSSKDCTHLALSVRSEILEEVSKLTNKKNERYVLCELCGTLESTNEVFVTDYGNRYHYIRSCSGLKRTVISIPFSEAYSYTPCSRCSGGS
jgi:hypothetical protein